MTANLPTPQPPPDPLVRRWYSRGYLVHYDVPGVVQLITFRQADSVPARLLRFYGASLAAAPPGSRAEKAWRINEHLEAYLARGRGTRRLADPRAAAIVQESLLYRDGRDYDLIAWIVMPNHVHVLIRRGDHSTLAAIALRWKSWTAKRINEIHGRSGRFWHPEVHDRYMRDIEDVGRAIKYVELNPVKADLCKHPLEWQFSSAHGRAEWWPAGGGREAEEIKQACRPSGLRSGGLESAVSAARRTSW